MPDSAIEEERNEVLAAYTDALLAGDAWEGEQRPPLADMVETLARTVGPEPVPNSLERQLKRTIQNEWPQERPSFRQNLGSLFRPATRRWVWGATGVLALLAVVSLALGVTAGGETVTGTVMGEAGVVLLAVAIVLGCVVGLAWWAGRRKR